MAAATPCAAGAWRGISPAGPPGLRPQPGHRRPGTCQRPVDRPERSALPGSGPALGAGGDPARIIDTASGCRAPARRPDSAPVFPDPAWLESEVPPNRSSRLKDHLEPFLARWQNIGGTERANYQLFLTELCALLDLPLPEPAGDNTRDNAYVFERRVLIKQPDGSSNNGFIDLYKRGCFVLEAKQTGKTLDS